MNRRSRIIMRVLLATVLATASVPFVDAQPPLRGAGATFPYPLYARMFDEYRRERGVAVSYQAVGSDLGVQLLLSGDADFAGSDAFILVNPDPANPLVHIPICIGAVVLTYNLPGNPTLRLSPPLLAGIFQGKIKRWSDPLLRDANPTLALPDLPITVVHRSDGSGTTNIFTQYLSAISDSWRATVGAGMTVAWPTGLEAKGNPGVVVMVQQQSGSIGYCELIYALQNQLPFALLLNRLGEFVAPSLESIGRSAQVSIPPDANASLVDTNTAGGYPIAGFTWVVLRSRQEHDGRSRETAIELVRLLWWMTHDGQRLCRPLLYAPLPIPAVRRAEALLRTITFEGVPLLPQS